MAKSESITLTPSVEPRFDVAITLRSKDGGYHYTTIFNEVEEPSFDVAPVYADSQNFVDENSMSQVVIRHDFGLSGMAFINSDGFYGYQIDHTVAEPSGSALEHLLPQFSPEELYQMAKAHLDGMNVVTVSGV